MISGCLREESALFLTRHKTFDRKIFSGLISDFFLYSLNGTSLDEFQTCRLYEHRGESMTASEVRQMVKRIIINKRTKELTFLELACAIFDKPFSDFTLHHNPDGSEIEKLEVSVDCYEEVDALLLKLKPPKLPERKPASKSEMKRWATPPKKHIYVTTDSASETPTSPLEVHETELLPPPPADNISERNTPVNSLKHIFETSASSPSILPKSPEDDLDKEARALRKKMLNEKWERSMSAKTTDK